MVKNNTPVTPFPGYILTQLHDKKETTFHESNKRILQKSIVLAIGDPTIDHNGNIKKCPANIGDIVLHHPVGREVDVEFKKYLIISFDEIYGSYKSQ